LGRSAGCDGLDVRRSERERDVSRPGLQLLWNGDERRGDGHRELVRTGEHRHSADLTGYCVGGSTTLTVGASGTSITYQWQSFNGSSWVNLANTASVTVSPSVQTQYRVIVSNSCRSVTSNTAIVTPDNAITITQQPQGANTCNTLVALRVVTDQDAYPDLAYQWQSLDISTGNWSNISGATGATYNASDGYYRVVVSNACGTATSNTAYVSTHSCGYAPVRSASFYGVYDPATGMIKLDQAAPDRVSAKLIDFNVGKRGRIVVGDWDGDGVATIGFYDPAKGTFDLWNADPTGKPDVTFAFGPTGPAWQPVAGDWDGDRVDTVGLVNIETGEVVSASLSGQL
jgi:hypothetical protein